MQAPRLAWRVPARGSVAGLAVKIPPLRGAPGRLAPQARKIPLHFVRRDFGAGLLRPGDIARSCLPRGRTEWYPPPGLACRLGRFAAERHRRSLTPSHAQTFPKEDSLPAWEGDGFI